MNNNQLLAGGLTLGEAKRGTRMAILRQLERPPRVQQVREHLRPERRQRQPVVRGQEQEAEEGRGLAKQFPIPQIVFS